MSVFLFHFSQTVVVVSLSYDEKSATLFLLLIYDCPVREVDFGFSICCIYIKTYLSDKMPLKKLL
jgi:hypothetical protein